MQNTWEFLQEGCSNFSEDPRNDERDTEETTVTDSSGFLGDARCSGGAETTGQRRAAR